MKPAPFDLHRPETLEEAIALLADLGDEARPLAGGQSLVAMMNLRAARPEHLVDLNRIAGLAGVALDGAVLRIGAMTRQQTLLSDPLVARHTPLISAAMPHVGHLQTRSRGTVGGSLVHADPAAELPLVAATLRAEIVLVGQAGERRVAAGDFFEDTLMSDVRPGEIVTEIRFPAAPEDARVSFREVSRRHGDFAIVAAAVQWSPTSGEARVGLGGIGATPAVCAGIEAKISGGEDAIDLDADLVGIDILSDPQADADYRRTLAQVTLARCVDYVRAR